MPSGPKKRARARRKKAGSPSVTTDANSDRETEALSVTGSMDVDDLESGLDTPKASMRPSYLDRATLSSQTDEWVRVSNFDVGTPTSQIGEDGDAISRRSLDRLAEWETVSGEQIPQSHERKINSLEEEPSEVEAASGHSSESFTHLPSPTHLPEGDGAKDHFFGKSNRSSSSSSSSSSSPAPPSVDTGEISAAPPPPALSAEEGQEVKRSNENPVEKEVVVHEAPDVAGPASSEETPPASDYPSHPFREVLISSSAEDISEVKSPVTIIPRVEEESTVQVDKEVLPVQAEEGGGDKKSHSSVVTEGSKNNEEHLSYSSVVVKEGSIGTNEEEREGKMPFSFAVSALGSEEEAPTSSTPVGVENKQVDVDERASITIGEDKEVVGAASTSADTEEGEKSKDFELATLVGKNSADQKGVGAHSGSEKALPTSGTSESVVAPASSTPVEKNGTGKPLLEVKPLSGGCCGVLYWLLRWDH